MLPHLSDEEIDDICAGLTQSAAKVRYLRGLGLTVGEKPNGRPLVARVNFDAVLGGVARVSPGQPGGRSTKPDTGAIIQLFQGKKQPA